MSRLRTHGSHCRVWLALVSTSAWARSDGEVPLGGQGELVSSTEHAR